MNKKGDFLNFLKEQNCSFPKHPFANALLDEVIETKHTLNGIELNQSPQQILKHLKQRIEFFLQAQPQNLQFSFRSVRVPNRATLEQLLHEFGQLSDQCLN